MKRAISRDNFVPRTYKTYWQETLYPNSEDGVTYKVECRGGDWSRFGLVPEELKEDGSYFVELLEKDKDAWLNGSFILPVPYGLSGYKMIDPESEEGKAFLESEEVLIQKEELMNKYNHLVEELKDRMEDFEEESEKFDEGDEEALSPELMDSKVDQINELSNEVGETISAILTDPTKIKS